MKCPLFALLAAVLPFAAVAEEVHVHASPYLGQESRRIKSLSEEDLNELGRGGGWGLAKAAELNGMPGPSHVLKMKRELALTAEQMAATQRVIDRMRADAVTEGRRLIAAELALDSSFQDRSIDEERLRARLRQIEASRVELRFIHLKAHLQTVLILSPTQVNRYTELRGYQR
ncbi:MAG: hypothetical protein KK478_17585 [Ensifer alkalisoli]|nr:hypothetical protein [Sinorhizobium alkalisoli]